MCVPVLPVVKTTRVGSCPLLAADRPTLPDKQVPGFHHPVHRLQAGFPEADDHGRELCKKPLLPKDGVYFLEGDPPWVLFGFCWHSASGSSFRFMCYPN